MKCRGIPVIVHDGPTVGAFYGPEGWFIWANPMTTVRSVIGHANYLWRPYENLLETLDREYLRIGREWLEQQEKV